jgi:hypothetical protein
LASTRVAAANKLAVYKREPIIARTTLILIRKAVEF